MAAAVALSRRQLLRKGFRALRWTLWLREARLEEAWGRHAKALLAQSFREWRLLAVQQKQGQPHVQAASKPCASWGSKDQVSCWRGKAEGHPTPKSSIPSTDPKEGPGQEGDGTPHRDHSEDAKDRCCPRGPPAPERWAMQVLRGLAAGPTKKGLVPGPPGRLPHEDPETIPGTMGVDEAPPSSDGAKVFQLSLGWQKAGDLALQSSAHSSEMVAQVSLQGACQRLALCQALLLWGTLLSQHQWASSFFQGTQERTLRHTLNFWCLRVAGSWSP